MQNKFLPYSRQLITDNDIKEVKKVLKSDFITQGPFIEKFEKELAKIVNSKFGVAMIVLQALYILRVWHLIFEKAIIYGHPQLHLLLLQIARDIAELMLTLLILIKILV